eukprot:m.24924 g.24924  ORF g.24924 m.24924 type:complete len:55 (-) comp13124_c0_seq3:1555-1719(-)
MTLAAKCDWKPSGSQENDILAAVNDVRLKHLQCTTFVAKKLITSTRGALILGSN